MGIRNTDHGLRNKVSRCLRDDPTGKIKQRSTGLPSHSQRRIVQSILRVCRQSLAHCYWTLRSTERNTFLERSVHQGQEFLGFVSIGKSLSVAIDSKTLWTTHRCRDRIAVMVTLAPYLAYPSPYLYRYLENLAGFYNWFLTETLADASLYTGCSISGGRSGNWLSILAGFERMQVQFRGSSRLDCRKTILFKNFFHKLLKTTFSKVECLFIIFEEIIKQYSSVAQEMLVKKSIIVDVPDLCCTNSSLVQALYFRVQSQFFRNRSSKSKNVILCFRPIFARRIARF